MTPPNNEPSFPNHEVVDLLKKLLVLHLFELGVPQAQIAKRMKMNSNSVSALLKGIRRKNA
jgi:hypothetical protein